uniref:Uncharacterized protein n=1 Tax=Rhizobium phage LG08 TaxID=3129229 RepID=A0AAU8HXS7_9CAUD
MITKHQVVLFDIDPRGLKVTVECTTRHDGIKFPGASVKSLIVSGWNREVSSSLLMALRKDLEGCNQLAIEMHDIHKREFPEYNELDFDHVFFTIGERIAA